MVDDGTRLYRYDAFNRLKTVKRSSDHKTIGEYTGVYPPRRDAMGRRIQKVIPDLGGGNGGLTGDIPAGTWDYLYTGVQCIEERDGANTVERQYVWGQYVDELIQYKKLVAPDAGTYYPLTDLLYRSVLLTKSDKSEQDAYDCDAYGNTLVFDQAGTGGNWFADDAGTTDNPKCQFIFTGRRYDPETSNAETQIYFYRARYYHPQIGRFLSKDPIGYAGGIGLYEYVNGTPSKATDPRGVLKTSTADKVVSDYVYQYSGSLAHTTNPSLENCAKHILGLCAVEDFEKAIWNIGMGAIFSPLQALPLGLWAKFGISVVEAVINAIHFGKADEENVINLIQETIGVLGPKELEGVRKLIAEIAKTQVGKLIGEGRATSRSYSFTWEQGKIEVKCFFFVSAKTKAVGLWPLRLLGLWEDYEDFTIFGSCNYTCKKQWPRPCCYCGPKVHFTVQAEGKKGATMQVTKEDFQGKKG